MKLLISSLLLITGCESVKLIKNENKTVKSEDKTISRGRDNNSSSTVGKSSDSGSKPDKDNGVRDHGKGEGKDGHGKGKGKDKWKTLRLSTNTTKSY